MLIFLRNNGDFERRVIFVHYDGFACLFCQGDIDCCGDGEQQLLCCCFIWPLQRQRCKDALMLMVKIIPIKIVVTIISAIAVAK